MFPDFAHLSVQLNDKKRLISERFHGVMVAHSGGADSTALLELLWRFSKLEKNFRLGVFHVNFGLRDKESELDESYSRAMAAERKIDFKCLKLGEKERLQRTGESVQEWARRIRYEAFRKLAAEGWLIAIAHHRDDLAENVLLRLARGTSPGTLLGMSEWEPPIWRPLLFEKKSALLDFLSREKIPHRVDASNDKLVYSRNVIRHKVLPELESLHKNAAERVVACAHETRQLSDWCKEQVRRQWQERRQDQRSFLRELPSAVAMTALTTLLEDSGLRNLSLSRRWLEVTLDRLRTDTISQHEHWSCDVPGGGRLIVTGDLLEVAAGPAVPKASRHAQHKRNLAQIRVNAALAPGSYALIRHDTRILGVGNRSPKVIKISSDLARNFLKSQESSGNHDDSKSPSEKSRGSHPGFDLRYLMDDALESGA